MAIEFEPTQWSSICGRFEIIKWSQREYRAYDNDTTDEMRTSKYEPTFADAVAWCESRAKQGQGQGEASP